MDQTNANPLFVPLFFIVRCLLPLMILLGVSYLLRRFGFIAPPPTPPYEEPDKEEEGEHHNNHINGEGGVAHA